MNLEQECNRAGSCVRHLRFSAVLTSVLAPAPEPAYPSLIRLFQSLHGRSCLPVLASEPRGLTLCLQSVSLSPW